ncbi:MAG: serine/threonine protein kinase [Deltaproteobacteria bacterium]|nr:MAG: serine/threonine protein kinase [Deltaproteobacteria bacterium]
MTAGLQSILQANIEALQIVVENERSNIQAWAKDREVRELTEQLLYGQSPRDTRRKLTEVLANVVDEDGHLGFAIIDAQGVIRATDQPQTYLDRALSPAAIEMLQPILEGKATFEKPFAKNALLEKGIETSTQPVLLAKAPITNTSNEIIAALVFTIDPGKDFTRILSVAEFGNTGSTYAFDDRGLMLSESRHEDQLKKLALIPDTPNSSAILTLQVRDPGVDLTKGKSSALPMDSRPLTKMAKMAITSQPGINVDGYRDYRGVLVVGAWQWLSEYGFGVATEVERSEALRSLRPVRLAFIALFGLLVITAISFLIANYFLKRLQSEVDELRELGQYTLVEKIGEGGMGKVYKARHAMLRRPTVIKLIREDKLDEKALERFEQEVQLTSQLTHPNTISIYDYGHSPDGVFYYAMEYLSGITLDQLVRIEKQVPADRVIYILQKICGSLSEAHKQGLIHRDIKPGNVMLCQRGGTYDFVKVLDFGLVRQILSDNHETNHQFGIMGTPGFIAPELLVLDRQVDARSDLYAVGALGFLMLTGQLVFSDKDVDTILHNIVNTEPPRPSEVTEVPIPEALDDLIHACLSRVPEERPASATELAEQLTRIILDTTWTEKEALSWWEENSSRIAYERKLERQEGSSVSETVINIDFGERS